MARQAEAQIFEGSLTVLGAVSFTTLAALDPSWMRHQFNKTYGQNGTAAAATQVLHEVRGTNATLRGIRAGSVVACTGNATITVDVKKNGTTILSATIVLDNANTAYISEAGTIPNGTLVAGDVLT